MMRKTAMSLALAAGCVVAAGTIPSAHAQYFPQPPQPYAAPQNVAGPPEMVTNGPQASSGDFGDWSAPRNVIESAQYDRLLATNLAFRQVREGKECGPINDPQLRQQCLASFQQYEPTLFAPSSPPWRHRRNRVASD